MGLWKATVTETREAVFYIRGEDREQVQEDADELADDISNREWTVEDTHVEVSLATDGMPGRGRIWSGGPDGDWE